MIEFLTKDFEKKKKWTNLPRDKESKKMYTCVKQIWNLLIYKENCHDDLGVLIYSQTAIQSDIFYELYFFNSTVVMRLTIRGF